MTQGQFKTACIDCTMYDPHDFLGHALALLSGAPYLIIFAQALIAYREREVRAWAALAGFVGSAAAGKALKRLAAQRRPAARCALLGNCGSFGMPSSHAQSMAFAWALHLCQARGRMQPRQAVESALLGALALVVCYARVYLGYHDAAQVGVGALVGASAGVAWACVLRAPCAQGWFEALVRSRLGCLLQLESGRGGSTMPGKCAPSTVAATQPSSREKQT